MADADYSNETWLPVPGWEGYYEVSDMGRVKSVPRIVDRRDGSTQVVRGGIMKGTWGSHRYQKVLLKKSGVREFWYVHRLVALAFIGPLPDGLETRHLDDDPMNNRLSNLAYGTRLENVADMVRFGNHASSAKTHCPLGHRLEEPNLIASRLPNRICKSCKSAINRRYRDPSLDKAQLADEAYAKIIWDAA